MATAECGAELQNNFLIIMDETDFNNDNELDEEETLESDLEKTNMHIDGDDAVVPDEDMLAE